MFWKKPHPITKKVFKVLLEKKFQGTYINRIYQTEHTLYVNINLPEGKERADLQKILVNLQEEVGATAVRIDKASGKAVEIAFGMRKLENTIFLSSLLQDDTLQVSFPSAYGQYILDFEDGASCHMLNGGTTRMGKTCLLLYLSTTLFLQTKGNMKLYISSAKLKDYYPFEGIPQVKMAMDIEGMLTILEEIVDEYQKRNKLLYSPTLSKATDAKSVRSLYPDSYHLFKPIFLIIDEYARFAESREIQRAVTEIVETAGFVNIHVIIASQRPDAQTVLKPRIRANLLVKMAFTTRDKKNSEVILDIEGAEKLGKIAGRAILIDGDTNVVQVPYLDVVECDKLLEPYRGEKKDEQDRERPTDSTVTDKIQSLLKESDSLHDLQGQHQPSECSKQGIEAYEFEWVNQPDTKRA